MTELKFYNRKLTVGWFLVMIANFGMYAFFYYLNGKCRRKSTFPPAAIDNHCFIKLFGVSGIIICSLKLRNLDNEDFQMGFFKLSMGFAACNLILSVLLLVSVLKRDQKYAFVYALLIFLSLFAATIHIESNTHKDFTFLIIFIVFAALCFLWFCVYGSYQIWLKDKITETDTTIAVV